MPSRADGLLGCVRRLAAQTGAGSDDASLLARFLTGRDPAAFEALVHRHGPMVLRVCRRVLGNRHDAEDAFQATFLVLARKAGHVQPPGALPAWLHGVAYRVAAGARAALRRRCRAAPAPDLDPPDPRPEPLAELTAREALQILEEEVHRLPQAYRRPLVLCCLEGLSQEEAARRLGWTPGSVRGRLERGRARLYARLARRGLAPAAALATLELSRATSPAGVPALLLEATTRGALAFATGLPALAAAGSGRVAVLTALGLRGTTALHAKLGLALVLTATVALAGAGGWACRMPAVQPSAGQDVASAGGAAGVRRAQATPSIQPPTDRYGDPLPVGAVARLGTLRLRHGGQVGFVRFTPDGKVLAAQGWRDGVRTWDVATGRQLGAVRGEAADYGVGAVDLSPDGKRLARADDTGIRLWDVPGCQPAGAVGAHPYFRVCFSPDGQLLAAVREKQRERLDLLDARTGRLLWSWSAEGLPVFPLGCVAFTADGKAVAVAGKCAVESPAFPANAVRFVDVATGRERRRIELGTDVPDKIRLSPDGRLLAVFCYALDGRKLKSFIRVWELADGKERFRLDPPSPDDGRRQHVFTALAFADGSRSLITAGGEDGLTLWVMATGKAHREFGRRLTTAQDLAVAPDGKAVAAGSAAGWVRVVDRASGRDLAPSGDTLGYLNRATLTPDGRTVVTIDGYGMLCRWDAATGRLQASLDAHKAGYRDHWAGLTGDGCTAFNVDSGRKAVVVYDTATGKEQRRLALDFVGADPRVRAVAPRGEVLAADTPEGDALYLVDGVTGRTQRTLRDPGRRVSEVHFTADGRTLAASRDNDTVQLWDVSTGARGRAFQLPAYVGPGWALSPDGRRFAYRVPWNGLLVVLDAATGEDIYRLPTPRGDRQIMQMGMLKFSADGRTLAWTREGDRAIHLVEVATGMERQTLAGHRGPIRMLAFAADGRTLVSGSADTTGLVWDLAGPAGPPPTAADLDACWAALAGGDAARAYRAERRLAAAPEQAVAYLRGRLRPATPADGRRVAALIADLGSDRFAARDQASRALERLGPAAEPACRESLRRGPAAEARRRLEALLERQARERRTPAGARLQALRALEVLEWIGTPPARQVIAALARGVPEDRLTQEARASLERVGRLPSGP